MNLRKGDVCSVNLSGSVGHEQFGNRPAIVFATTDTSIVVVIPLSANLDASRFTHTVLLSPSKNNGLVKQSVAFLFHIRAIEARRIEKNSGHVDEKTLRKIDSGIRLLLSL